MRYALYKVFRRLKKAKKSPVYSFFKKDQPDFIKKKITWSEKVPVQQVSQYSPNV